MENDVLYNRIMNVVHEEYGPPSEETKEITITENGTITEDVRSYASAKITTAVPNSYTESDEGKVVDSGALVSQSSATYTENDTYDTTLINSVTVNVSGGLDINAIAMGTEPSGDVVMLTATDIKERKFKECNNITSVTAPAVLILREQIFNACTNLESISFDNASTINSSLQFAGCTKLTDVNLPKISALAANMFNGCTSLEEIDLPLVTNLGAARIFYNCNKLNKIILRYADGVVPVSNEALANTPFSGYNSLTGTVYVPSALISSYQSAANWNTLYNNGTCIFSAIEGSPYE